MCDFVNISDKRVRKIIACENNEKFCDLIKMGFRVDITRSQIANQSPYFSFVRISVAEKLKKARKTLPPNIDFLIKEGYRPLSQQKQSYEKVKEYVTNLDKNYSDEEIDRRTNLLCASVDVAPHPAGAAVDLTLFDKSSGKEFNLGTEYNASPFETDNATFLHADNISYEAKALRVILVQAMDSVGFVCYPSEWWHWSYGDKYWAFINGKDKSIFSAVSEENIVF